MKQQKRGLGRFTRWAIVFLILLALFMLLISKGNTADGMYGRYTPWIIAFLLILVLLTLLIPLPGKKTGVFGRFTPFVVVFLIIYIIVMFFLFFSKKGNQSPRPKTPPYQVGYQGFY